MKDPINNPDDRTAPEDAYNRASTFVVSELAAILKPETIGLENGVKLIHAIAALLAPDYDLADPNEAVNEARKALGNVRIEQLIPDEETGRLFLVVSYSADQRKTMMPEEVQILVRRMSREMGPRQKEVIEQLCKMMNRVQETIDIYGHTAADCICKPKDDYRNEGAALELMEEAISALIGAYNNPKNTEEHRGERVASNFLEEHIHLVKHSEAAEALKASLAKWFQKHAEAAIVRSTMKDRKKIVGVAIRDTEDRIWSLPAPLRHMHVQALMREHGAKQKPDNQWNQGFIDEDGKYLTRKQAIVNAEMHEQVKGGQRINAATLLSEDLW